jgi:hypothetical protein
MKLHMGGLVLVLFSLLLPVAAQDNNTINPAYKKIVWNDTIVTLNGPNGTGPAPTVLQVIGGAGGRSGGVGGVGSGIQLTAGGGGFGRGPGGDGGSITFMAGKGGTGIQFGGGKGGSITLQSGEGGNNARPGNVLIALPPEGTLDVAVGGLTLADA